MVGKLFIIIAILFLGSAGTGIIWLKRNFDNGRLQEKVIGTALPSFRNSIDSRNIFQSMIGMGEPRTYLVLFLNNTEIRPGGGFIGSYAVVRFDHGKPEILKVEGTEIIDNSAAAIHATPTPELAKYLGIKNWQFRDSNWSPDFPTDAKRALDLYAAEGGFMAGDISGVIAFTPNVVEEVLKLVGPLTVEGINFTSDNFTETLEYEVEYGFEKRGVQFRDRKQLIGDAARALLPRLAGSALIHWKDYMELIPAMLRQKQIMLYSTAPDETAEILKQGWGGAMNASPGDYLLWADANLDSLKTDVAITRSLSYTIAPSSTGFIAEASMRYNHTGGFTWRTSRYRDYVRIFVPSGSRLIGSAGNNTAVDEGDENGRHWFGTFISISPGAQGRLSFTYALPEKINNDIKDGAYRLSVQKQPGTGRIRLTVELKFDRNLAGAAPAESSERFGDNLYQVTTDLGEDRQFVINFK